MKTLFKNAKLVDVLNHQIINQEIVVKDKKIIYVGNNYKKEVDKIVDLHNKYVCPSFIDGHIHIESTMLSPFNFAKVAIMHGTCAVVEDPHEITNVAGVEGIKYMLKATNNLPIDVFVMIPSCVPATRFDESMQAIKANMMLPFLKRKRVLGLGELMDFYGAINGEEEILNKINVAKQVGKYIDGHAPGLVGKDLEKYISLGIHSDHECSTTEEAIQRIKLGMWVMIRQGSAAKNLEALLPLFDSNADKCMLVTDDLNAADLLSLGHIDRIVRKAIEYGKDPITTIQLATINAAKCFNLKRYGAIAKGYLANFIVLDDLKTIKIRQVYKDGKLAYDKAKKIEFIENNIDIKKFNNIYHSMKAKPLQLDDLMIKARGIHKTRIIEIIPHELITNQLVLPLDYDKNNGIDVDKDILKIVVVERHNYTGHMSIGYIKGLGLKSGAIASTVSHDSHNIIAIGCSEKEILKAINKIIEIGGGEVIVKGNKVIDYVALGIGGLMSLKSPTYTAKKIEEIRQKVYSLGISKDIEPYMNMAFISLPVIPHIKITTKGLVDVDKNELVSLLVD